MEKNSNLKKLKDIRIKSKTLIYMLKYTACLVFFFKRYHSNSWLVRIASNGRYLLAPTALGQIFAFNMLTGEVTAIIKEHEGNIYIYK